jgi:pteridine reductase
MNSRGAVLVTGSAGRLGAAMAKALAELGYDIALHCHTSKSLALQLADEIKKSGRACEVFEADLSNEAAMLHLIPQVKNLFPSLNVLINNASIFHALNLKDTTPEQYDAFMNLHVKVPFFLTQQFAKTNPLQGHVINMVDAKIDQTVQTHASYLLSKKALAEFTRLAAKTYAPAIRVNGIAPGPVLWGETEDEAYHQKVLDHLPLKKIGAPQNVISAMQYLLENEYVTGEILYVSGGQHL